MARLAVRLTRQTGHGWQNFHVLQFSQDDLGSLFTPAVWMFASADLSPPEPDCVLFGASLISLFGLFTVTMLTSVQLI